MRDRITRDPSSILPCPWRVEFPTGFPGSPWYPDNPGVVGSQLGPSVSSADTPRSSTVTTVVRPKGRTRHATTDYEVITQQ